MQTYVSGKFSTWKVVSEYICELKEIGCEITWDWTTEEARSLPANQAAIVDAKGALECELHVVILDDPNHPYRGTWCEMGISLAQVLMGANKKIIVCNLTENQFTDFPFYHHPEVTRLISWRGTKQYIKESLMTQLDRK